MALKPIAWIVSEWQKLVHKNPHPDPHVAAQHQLLLDALKEHDTAPPSPVAPTP